MDSKSVSRETSSSACLTSENEEMGSSSLKMMYDKDLEDQTQELKALGINVIDQISLEQNVAAAVDEAVMKHTRKQKLQILKKEVKESKFEIMKMKNKENDYQHRLTGMQQRLTDPRQYLSVEKSLKESKEELEALQKRKKYIEEKLMEATENESVLDEVDLNLEEGELFDENEEEQSESKPKNDWDREKMIKEGKMTPFGTVLNSNDTQENISSKSALIKPWISTIKAIHSTGKETLNQCGTSAAFHKPLPVLKPSNRSEVSNTSSNDTSGISEFEKYLQDQIDKQRNHSQDISLKKRKKVGSYSSYGNFKKRKHKPKEFIGDVSIDDEETTAKNCITKEEKKKKSPLKKKVLHPKRHWKEKNLGSITSELESDQHRGPGRMLSERMTFNDKESEYQFDSDYVPSEGEELPSDEGEKEKCGKVTVKKENAKPRKTSTRSKMGRTKDDGHLESYVKRIKQWREERLKEKQRRIVEGEDLNSEEEDDYEKFEGGYKIPLSIWNKLYKYQKTCVKWLWELHCQNCGGILGDEMGLGKTIMVISFLVGLSYSGLVDRGHIRKGLGPVLIVSPATVLHQWVRELHKWWPPFRVAVLHDSGAFTGKKSALIHNINKHDGILITSYRGVIDQLKVLLNYDWHYIILDEGHKIRNPNAQITVAVKRFHTPHRIILSGSPIQNSLKELWSLFDFVFPGKLGTMPVFLQQFAVPITQGGYANASKLEVQTAFRCATVLRDSINPYLLRRMKNDVRNDLTLPNKNEQVLFCGLTEEQRTHYRDYLDGNQVKCILSGRFQIFVGLINLRKICNHPDLYDGGPKHFVGEDISGLQPEKLYGWWKRSGKMVVLHSILKLWKTQSHRVLLFTQSRQMMRILEKYVQDESYTYLKMDGCTSVGSRQPLIERFNKDSSIFVFLLTTRVGGIGVNLTGADRVVIYDPDWNPSTDTQARERAWRIGQTRHVTIYRLLTAGTIEEKIYHRQVFKQFLTNRVLKDPKQQRFFKTNDLYELFTLNEGDKEKTETSAIFAGTGSEIQVKPSAKNKEKLNDKSLLKSNKGNNRNNTLLNEEYSCMNRRDDSVDRKDDSANQKHDSANSKHDSRNQNDESSFKMSYEKWDNEDDEDDENALSEIRVSINESSNDSVNCDKETDTKLLETNDREETSRSDETKTDVVQSEDCKDYEQTSPLREEEKEEEEEEERKTIMKSCSEMEEKEKREKMRALAKMLSKKISKSRQEGSETLNGIGICSKEIERSKKKRRKDSKKKEGKKFEGERIQNLVKKRKYKYADEENEEQREELNKSQDDFVLQKLFKKSGVHTALSHDVILNSGDPDYLLLESEADRVAKEALRQVRLSRMRCFQPNSDESLPQKEEKKAPKFGRKKSLFLDENEKKKKKKKQRGRGDIQKMFNGGIEEEEDSSLEEPLPDATPSVSNPPTNQLDEGASSGVLSSAQLLKRMRERNKGLEEGGSGGGVNRTRVSDPYGEITYDPDYPSTSDLDNPIDQAADLNSDPEFQVHVELLTDIRNFVAFQATSDGCASTDEILGRFRERLPTNQNHIFRALLNQICDFIRDSSGQGYWHIKGEFR